MVNLSEIVKLNRTSSPKKKYDVKTDDTDAINNGSNEAKVKSRLNTSIAKIIAAMGDLKIEAIAPAAAQPISKFFVFLST